MPEQEASPAEESAESEEEEEEEKAAPAAPKAENLDDVRSIFDFPHRWLRFFDAFRTTKATVTKIRGTQVMKIRRPVRSTSMNRTMLFT